MPRLNFKDTPDAESDYSPLPDGRYLIEVSDVNTRKTSKGDEMWNLSLQVLTGAYRGRLLFDNLVFSDAAMSRVKLILKSLGFDVSGVLDLRPSDIITKQCYVQVAGVKDYTTKTGEARQQSNIPFSGYYPLDTPPPQVAPDDVDDDNIPF